MKQMSFSEFCQKMEQYNMVPGDNEQPKAGLETERERIFYIKCRKTHRSLACGM